MEYIDKFAYKNFVCLFDYIITSRNVSSLTLLKKEDVYIYIYIYIYI